MPTLIENKKVRLDYEIVESYEAGIELEGLEVKALRARHGNLAGAYVIVRGGEAFLVAAHIPPYQENNTPESYDPYRNRRLLLKKAEIAKLVSNTGKKNGNLTIVPISVYSKDGQKSAAKKASGDKENYSSGKIKVEIALVKGKKKYDKRQSLKKRETEREISRRYAL
jgi:SsrA-binding protein